MLRDADNRRVNHLLGGFMCARVLWTSYERPLRLRGSNLPWCSSSNDVFIVVLVEVRLGHTAGWYIWSTVAAGMPSSVATASTACWATLRSTRPSEVKYGRT